MSEETMLEEVEAPAKEVREGLENCKVAFHDILGFLMDHPEHKVKNILEGAMEFAKMKARVRHAISYIKDSEGAVVAIKCLYFDRWMPLVGEEAVEFGVKNSTATGLNSYSAAGLKQWNGQQAESRKSSVELLKRLKSKEITVDDLDDEETKIEAARVAVIDSEAGFATKEEVMQYLEDEGIEVAVA